MHDIAQMLMMGAAGQSGQASRETGGSEAGDLASVTTFTTAALSIGTAAANRFVVVAVTVDEQSYGTPVISAVTIGGNAATELVRYSTTRHCTALWGLAVASGTTAAIGVTIDKAVEAYAVAITAAYGVIGTPSYTVASAPSSGGGAITGVRNGLVVAATSQSGANYNTGVVTVDTNVSSGASAYCACQKAYALPSSSGSLSPLNSGTGSYPYVAASFAPI